LQTQLSSAKAAYETEAKLLSTFRERRSAQMAEMQKSQEDLIRAESDLSALRVEKSEIEGAFLRDKEEVRDFHRKMAEVGQQVESLKSDIEKTKKDAKQQKGLLAIAKKQLSSRETEKAKFETELGEAHTEVAFVTKEREETESDIVKLSTPLPDKRDLSSDSLTFAANHALPISPDPSSPAGSVAGKSNNPFERLALSPGTSLSRSQSPFLPFGDASQPTPFVGGDVASTETTKSTNDTSGSPQGLESFSQVTEVNGTLTESRRSTPKFDASLDSVLSPASTEGSDRYVTPPTTASNQRAQTPVARSSASPAPEFPTAEDVASNFPDIRADNASPGQFSAVHEEHHRETDLAAQLKEIEAQESDSESDSEDEVPLAELAKAKTEAHAPAVLPTAIQGITAQPKVSFDDIFGVTPPPAAETNHHPSIGAENKGAIVSSIHKPSTDTVSDIHIVSQSEAPTVSGVSAFDEAMGLISNSAPPSEQQFSFDSAFDDDFDFANASPLPQAPTTVTEGIKDDNSSTIDSASAVPPHKPALAGSVPNDLPTKAEPPKPTFDEAFLNFDSGPALDLNSSFSPTRQVIIPDPTQATFPVSSPPISPKFISSPPTTAASPTRAKSPPPRVSSPKPRPSTSSSKETSDKLKEPPTRHSKLSVRN
jgi:epidermal growth factor receptor substrate 15